MERDRSLPETTPGGAGGGPPAEEGAPEGRTDQQVTEAVYLAFFLDPTFSTQQFHVETVDAVVRLAGGVHSEAERRRALDLVANVQGVNRVVDELVVV